MIFLSPQRSELWNDSRRLSGKSWPPRRGPRKAAKSLPHRNGSYLTALNDSRAWNCSVITVAVVISWWRTRLERPALPQSKPMTEPELIQFLESREDALDDIVSS